MDPKNTLQLRSGIFQSEFPMWLIDSLLRDIVWPLMVCMRAECFWVGQYISSCSHTLPAQQAVIIRGPRAFCKHHSTPHLDPTLFLSRKTRRAPVV